MPVASPLPAGPFTTGAGNPGPDMAAVRAYLLEKGAATDAELQAATAAKLDTAVAVATYAAFPVLADKTLYVSKNGLDTNSGLGAGNAKRTISAAITAGAGTTGVRILVGAGTYIEDLKLVSGIQIIGVSPESTVLQTPAGSTQTGCVMINNPAVACNHVTLENLSILGNGNAGQHGLYFNGTAAAGSSGGFQLSKLRNVNVQNFAGNQMWLRGGGTTRVNANQFLLFEDCYLYASATNPAILMSGQCGQITFINGGADGAGGVIGSGTNNVRMVPECSDAAGTAFVSAVSPYSVDFLGHTSQNTKTAYYINGSGPINFINPHLENCWGGMDFAAASHGRVEGGAFAVIQNAGAGFGVQAGSGCFVRVAANDFAVVDHSYQVTPGSFGVIRPFSNREGSGVYSGTGLTYQVPAAATLNLSGAQTVVVNTGATAITTINSHLGPGECLFLKALSGTITLATGGNIDLGGNASPLTVNSSQVVTLARFDLASAWQLVARS